MSVKAPSHPDLAQPPGGAARVIRELDHARKSGVHREIVIPPCPERLVELRAALDGAEPDLAAVSRIASRDVAMAGTLVRNANCARFAAGQPVATVGQAMNRLGLETTSALMTGFLARHALPVRHPRLQGFWDRATLRSTALALVARRLPGLSVDLAYSFGLFCDVGMPVLAQCLRGYGGTLVEAAARIDRPLVATENANHRTDHCVVGAMVARAWGFAPPVACAIRLHHDFAALGAADIEPEVHTLVAAGLVAEHLMRQSFEGPADADWKAHGAACLEWLRLYAEDVEDLHNELSAVAAAA
ncbi:MAG: HDOD domain-containing protein [Betaproteobacteria bacterium]|nr:HDOD domain-containing protein [Betaproteobacteria bacterium]MCC6250230.1 HDOD domain-containing protein [Rubrivivax sp.]MCL4696190.1 HDOD domain-containing protein [Burkholderiaceae bacterium]